MNPADTATTGPEALIARSEEARRAGRIDEAIAFARQAVEAAGDAVSLALARIELANLLRYVPETLQALQLLAAAQAVLRPLAHPQLARVLVLEGMAIGDAGQHAAALDRYREALRLLEAEGAAPMPAVEGLAWGAIGLACTQLDDFEQAETAYRRAFDLYAGTGQPESLPFILNNRAILRVRSIQRLGRPGGEAAATLGDEMLALIDQGLELNRAGGASALADAMLLNTRGDGLRALGRTDEALPCLREALAIFRRIGNVRGGVEAVTDLAAALLEAGDVAAAIRTIERARGEIAGRDIKDHERRLEELAAEAHERNGDPATALVHYKAFMQLSRELQDDDVQRRLLELSVRAEIDRARRESREDPLTGIANRRRFEEWTREHWGLTASRCALATIDVDHFKRINDEHSHAAGDAVLKALGRLLRRHCRDTDFVARMGGEEFVLLLREVDAKAARESCERLRDAVERHEWKRVWPGLTVTVSIGVAVGDGSTRLDELMKRADEKLYEAKRGGRNRVAG